MALGSNLNFNNRKRKMAKILMLLGNKRYSSFKNLRTEWVCSKAGAPATNTANDNPGRKGVLCLDVTNNAVYICSAFTSGTVFTWTQIA